MANNIHKIRELCEITSSKRIYVADYKPEGVPFYRGKEISEKYRGNLDVSTELFIDRDKFEQIRARFGAPMTGDLLLTSVGTLGSPYVVNEGEEFYFKDGNLTWFRNFKYLDSGFLYFWLQSPQGKAELKKCTIGSSQSAYTIVLLKEMEISLPPLPTQRKIAAILSAYDDLIENNTRRIRILEEMAQSIYREWFVHFRFPGHQHARFIDSPLGRIPEGWEAKRVLEFGNIITGKTPSKANPDFYGEDVPFVKTPDMHGNTFIIGVGERLSVAGAQSQANKTIPAGSICVSCIGTVGVVSITTENCQTNQQINSVAFMKEQFREFLFLRLKDAKQALENLGANGATMGNVNKGKFESLAVITPSDDLVYRYHEFAAPLFSKMLVLSRKNTTSRRTRDLLLPKLISGELDVENLNILTDENS